MPKTSEWPRTRTGYRASSTASPPPVRRCDVPSLRRPRWLRHDGVPGGRIDGVTGVSKPGGAVGPAVRGSPYGGGPGATGAERGRAGDADRLAGASPGDPDLEVRGPDCGATPAARRPAVQPVPAGVGPAHGRGGARLVPAGVPRRERARSIRQVRR